MGSKPGKQKKIEAVTPEPVPKPEESESDDEGNEATALVFCIMNYLFHLAILCIDDVKLYVNYDRKTHLLHRYYCI